MFHSSFPFVADPEPTLLPAVCSSDAAPQPFYDAGGPYPLLFSSFSPPCPSSFPYHLPRSSSTQSLVFPDGISERPPPLPPASSPSSNSGHYFDFNDTPVRRVFSTGDLQVMTAIQAAGDNYNQEVSEVPGRIGRYTAEERKERIERYRSKRSQRNFYKKITYECRKTLADSRPRVRGRFARNGETETETEPEVKTDIPENSYDCHSSYNINEQAPSGVFGNGDQWSQIMAVLAMAEEEEFCYQDLCAYFSDVRPMNLPF
ncbi:zinc finger protein CONSTANS-LIKE 5 [Phoenix dactylifera]|uniref:Zinc finger protein CONSTANS-LIKE 5 n=1 Tax=Phoenix dactylifera TaxID=42345 RepID=A0A8B8J239_PHODC|nr:zinc finger protein CONSTANS-LIKE 5 [Phoenix dactylifera]